MRLFKVNIKNETLCLIRVCLLIILTRIILGLLFDHLLLMTFPLGPWAAKPPINWVVGFNYWDSGWYNSIASQGYFNKQSTAFFPAFPILIKLTSTLGVPVQYCGVIISIISFIIGGVILYKLAKDLYGDYIATITLTLLAWSPTSVFLLSSYTESMFLLFTLLSFYFYDLYKKKNNRYDMFFCLICAGIVSSIRLTGTIVMFSILIEIIWSMRNEISIRFILKIIGYSLIGEFGFILYAVYLFFNFNNPLLFLSAEDYWGRITTLPYQSVYYFLKNVLANPNAFNGNIFVVFTINVTVALAALFILLKATYAYVKNKVTIPLSWLIYSMLLLIISTSTAPGGQSPESIARYIMVIFYLYIGLALFINKKIVCLSIIPITILLALLGQSLYNLGYWFT